jgi:eukaryotic-like serine/threonine-protein kinase
MEVGDKISGRFEITGHCSTSGGMGNVVFVSDISGAISDQLVLKYCKSFDPKLIKRFKREVQLLDGFSGNSKVAQIVAHDLSHTPPYYVMEYYPDGDLTNRHAAIVGDAALQEQTFCDAIDCISELHNKGVFHRDIKPQNFLQCGNGIIVSDMGLSVEIDSDATTITSTAEAWGTFGYAPPEFRSGGFKNPDAAGDIFMIGKTFYQLLTGRDPVYMTDAGIEPGIYYVLNRACSPDKMLRYQNLGDLKQAIVAAYDIVLNRVDGINSCRSNWETINSRIENEHSYVADEVIKFIDLIAAIDQREQDVICQQLTPTFFGVIAQDPFDSIRADFIEAYGKMVRNGNYGWSFAERIASCVQQLFNSNNVPSDQKADALNLAIHAAYNQNRFNAMATCTAMVTSVTDDELAGHVSPILLEFSNSFIANIEPVNCQNDIIARTINQIATTNH